MTDERRLSQLMSSLKSQKTEAPNSWTVRQFIDFKIKEFGLDGDLLLPNGQIAPDEMTLGELRKLYSNEI